MATRGSTIYKGSDLIYDFSCSTCEENDLNSEAQHFCSKCEHYLCDKCVNIHGDYFKKHVVYGRGDIGKWTESSMDRCDQHGNNLELYCNDHHDICCSVCVVNCHRQCSSLLQLSDMAKGFLKSASLKQLPEVVSNMNKRLCDLIHTMTVDQSVLKDSYKNVIAEIKALRQEINTILEQLEKRTVEQLESMMTDLEERVKHDIETCAQMHDQLKSIMEAVRQMSSNHKEKNTYIGYKKCDDKLTQADGLIHEMQAKSKEKMRFQSEGSVLPFLKNLKVLGEVKTADVLINMSDRSKVYRVNGSHQYVVKIEEDKSTCNITGICELQSGEFVIVDHNNESVKLLNSLYQVIDSSNIPGRPYDICHSGGNEVAVAVYKWGTGAVHVFTVNSCELQEVRTFTTDHPCISIAYHNGLLYPSSRTAMYQYTMDGQQQKKVYENKCVNWSVYQCGVSPDGERIYVTDGPANKLITLSRNGHVLSTLDDPELIMSGGICVSPNGYLFVSGDESNTVIQVDSEGTKKLVTVATKSDGLCKPWAVCFSERTSSLIVANDKANNIIVFKLC